MRNAARKKRPPRKWWGGPSTATLTYGTLAVMVLAMLVILARGGSDPKLQAGASTPAPIVSSPPALELGTSTKLPLPPGSKPYDGPVPILMYHVINNPPPDAPYPELYVASERFADEMTALANNGYHAVTPDQVWAAWSQGKPLAPKPIVVTFDDGYRSVYDNAFPVLRRLRWPGVVNLELDILKKPWGLKPEMVRKLIMGGWEIDSHTVSHPDLAGASANRLAAEVAGSRERLRSEFGVPANFIAYPSGSYDKAVIDAAREAGYTGGLTTTPGLADQGEMFELKRIRVAASDTADSLIAKLSGSDSG
jgi:peptidoglycan/xylan/chitin deacetylase (PgdA/CDA1 family)